MAGSKTKQVDELHRPIEAAGGPLKESAPKTKQHKVAGSKTRQVYEQQHRPIEVAVEAAGGPPNVRAPKTKQDKVVCSKTRQVHE